MPTFPRFAASLLAGGLAVAAAHAAQPAPTATPVAAKPTETRERVIVIRHGEKPAKGLGQLECRGLARALALPDVIVAKFGVPNFLMAPNPAHQKPDRGVSYAYIRPLATIEPLAIREGLPVDVRFGFDDVRSVVRVLERWPYANATVLVAWEHRLAPTLVRDLIKRQGGDATQVQDWNDDDFDRIDIVEIRRPVGAKPVVTYARDNQGLNGIPGECPRRKPPQ